MSIRIVLDSGPAEYFSSLDDISGRVVLNLNRGEQVGAVVVKLEGESRTSLAVPTQNPNHQGNIYPGSRGPRQGRLPGSMSAPGHVMTENHKVLYKVQQVFPGAEVPVQAGPMWLQPGLHTFPFTFKIPMNNMCGDPRAMAQLGGIGGPGGFTDSANLFGIGGIRVMDGSRQLLYAHVNRPLPPSFTGLPNQAEVSYYVKVTIQRPGLLKENWRYKADFRFMPLEPPRPQPTGQEAYARRRFPFRPRSPLSASAATEAGDKKKKSFFGSGFASKKDEKSTNNPFFTKGAAEGGSTGSGGASNANTGAPGSSSSDGQLQKGLAPSVEMSARLPYPSILTMGKPLPLKIMGKKIAPSRGEHVFLISLQIELVGTTKVRCNDLNNVETSRWVIVSKSNLKIPVIDPEGPVGSEIVLPSSLCDNSPLAGGLGQAGMTPSFTTCNLGRTFSLELKFGISWGLRETLPRSVQPQAIFLPLNFSSVEVYSGMVNPDFPSHSAAEASGEAQIAPALPPRRPTTSGPVTPGAASTNTDPASPPAAAAATRPMHNPPAQDSSGGAAPQYEAPPPSYEEAMGSKT